MFLRDGGGDIYTLLKGSDGTTCVSKYIPVLQDFAGGSSFSISSTVGAQQAAARFEFTFVAIMLISLIKNRIALSIAKETPVVLSRTERLERGRAGE